MNGRALGSGLVFIIAILTRASVAASDLSPASEPTAAERLAAPVSLLSCPGMTVVEWRSSTADSELTRQTSPGVTVIDSACGTAVARYPAFLRSEGLTFDVRRVSARLMLMPANTALDGRDARNLNDTTGRFRTVQPKCCSWGIYDSPTRAVFLRNDPLLRDASGSPRDNPHFTRTVLHEMAHLLNDQWDVRARHFPGNNERDEELAERWIRYLGITLAVDSNDENLRALRRSASRASAKASNGGEPR